MKFILGEKSEMTQKFSEDGTVIPVTKVVAGPCVVTQVKSVDKDGYSAVQVGYGQKKRLNQAEAGHLKNLGKFHYLREFRLKAGEEKNFKVGNKVGVNIFKAGDIVKVTGISKGKGFQGVVRRHGFSGSPATHGHKDQLRMPGSIGASGPANVFKGTRMPGHMGSSQVTVTNLEIIEVDDKKDELFIKGAIPGWRSGLVLVSGPGEIKLELDQKGLAEEISPENPEKEKEIKEEKKSEAKK